MILLTVLLIVIILLILPLCVKISYSDELSVVLSYSFFKFSLPKKKIKKVKKTSPKKVKGTSAFDELKKNIKKQDKLEIVKLIKRVIKLLIKNLKVLWGHLSIKKFCIDFEIASKDASKTAIMYGNACSFVYSFASFLKGSKDIKCMEVDVRPLFDEEDSKIKFETEFSIRIIFILMQAFSVLISLLKIKKTKRMVKV